MTPSMVSVALPLLVAGALAVVVRFRFRWVRILAGVLLLAAAVAFKALPSAGMVSILLLPAGWLLLTTAIAHHLVRNRWPIEHSWRHAIIAGATLGGFATASAIVLTGQDRRHTAHLATLAWVAGAVSPLGGLGTLAVFSQPEWVVLGIPLLAACALALRSRSRTAAIPPQYTLERITPAALALGIGAFVLATGSAWAAAEWLKATGLTPLQTYGLTLLASIAADPAVLAVGADHVLRFEPFGNGWNGLAIWLGIACTPVPVLFMLFFRFGGSVVRDLKPVFIPALIGLAAAVAMTTS